jgi:hypothetical protein
MLLRAGSITVWYESGFLRYINYGPTELLRMVYFALRDENWNTIQPVIENEDINAQHNTFSINYDCSHQKNGATIFGWQVTITGDENGKITFEIDGRALTGFLKNRLGFCLLHPLGNYAGQSVTITHPNGTFSQTQFPEYIAGGDVFKDIKSFGSQSVPVPYTIDFEGDVFETEDQRNWADASFKTYCTPLGLPFPVQVNSNDRVYQKITFTPEISSEKTLPETGVPIQIIAQDEFFTLPDIGIGASTESDILSAKALDLLRALGLDHYAVDIEPSNPNWINVFTNENEQAKKLKLPIIVKLHLSDDFINEIAAFTAVCISCQAAIKAIALLSKGQPVTHQNLINYAGQVMALFPGVMVGAGTNFNFTEINRHRFNPADAQFISYSTHPQEHAFDDLTLIENIAAQAETIKSTKNIYGDSMPVFVAPITLKKRFNPYATTAAAIVKSDIERADERQATDFCALFTLGCIKSHITAGTASVTFFQTVGNQGIISLFDEPYPVYQALKLVLNNTSKTFKGTLSSDPVAVDSLLFKDNMLLLWNYTTLQQTILLPAGNKISLAPRQIKTLHII